MGVWWWRLTLARWLLLLRSVPDQPFYPILFATFAFILGAAIGSYLNVCIYRMPRNLSTSEPRRSFCPSCKYQIPWSSNLPLITWLVQLGRCRNCGTSISVRYFLVELLTGVLFLVTWWRVSSGASAQMPAQWVLFFPLATFISMLVVATFIDFEFFEIPDEITIGGTFVGIAFSLGLPQMHGEAWGNWQGHLWSGLWAVIGAAAGFGLLWVVSTLGKLAFGKKKEVYAEPKEFVWTREGENAWLEIDGKKREWMDLFTSEKDVLVMECTEFELEGEKQENFQLRTKYLTLQFAGKEHALEKTDTFRGKMREMAWTRDAMGFGDVKFIACIGAFLGWKSVLFTVMAASVIGSLVGVISIILGRRDWSAKIPFGPYLSIGALIWIFTGPELVAWYVSAVSGPPAPTYPSPFDP